MFSQLIKTHRMSSGLSVTELGAKIGRDASTISRWERGIVQPSVRQTITALTACGCTAEHAVSTIAETMLDWAKEAIDEVDNG